PAVTTGRPGSRWCNGSLLPPRHRRPAMSPLPPLRRWLVVLHLAALVAALVRPAPGLDQTARGTKHALLVGVLEYDSPLLEKLKFTENDVEELGKVLSGKGGFAEVRLLTTRRGQAKKDDAPTAANIRAALAALLAGKKRDDTVLVALAGHGIQMKVKEGTK